MRVLVTKTTRAASDGLTVRRYEAGQSYDLPADLARVFIAEGWGRAMEAAPANKAFERAPEPLSRFVKYPSRWLTLAVRLKPKVSESGPLTSPLTITWL